MGTKEAIVAEPVPAGQAEGALIRREDAGVMGLALMADKDFENRLEILKKGQERVRRIQKDLMVKDEDYGVIPGTPKPTLLKPGAEKLCNVYGLVATFDERTIEGDGEATPTLRVRVTCYLHRGSKDGPVVAEGSGAANSWEKKHRYRAAERACPSCGVVGTIRRSKFPDRETGDKGWYCHDKKGGCGTNFHSEDPSITDQQLGQVENPDPFDVENTLVKMATKRAYVDATLRATATSGLFTQDLEDDGGGDGHDAPAGGAQPGATKPSGKPQASGQAPVPARAAQPQGQRPAASPQPTKKAPAPPQAAAQGQANATGRWQGPCPRCKKTGAVIKSRYDEGWVCWSNQGGCGYKWTPADAQIHQQAEDERGGDLFDEGAREPGQDG